MRAKNLWLLGFAVALFSVLATNSRVRARDDTQFEWVITNTASALAVDGSSITLTGTGTFAPDDPEEVTGGGTWTVSTGGSGTFKVTGLIRFDPAPSSGPNQAGLGFFRIAYSDGSRGVLTVSCLTPGTPVPGLEDGAHSSKGFVDYFNRQTPTGPVFFKQLSGN